MVRVNLLPHRQLKRAERQRQFNLMFVAVFVAAGAVLFVGQTYISTSTDIQTARNKRLEDAIVVLDKQIEEIGTLKSKINEVLDRKKIVEDLQTNRSQAVVLLDEVARKMPEGIYLRKITQEGALVTLEGVADTNARIATYVRNFNNSEYMQNPGLIEIKADLINGVKRSLFTMNVSQIVRQPEEASDKKKILKATP